MADRTVKYNVVVDSNGTTEKETKKALQLNQVLKDTANIASKLGTTGSRKAVQSTFSNQDYRIDRSTMGTGDARDFAKQSQGLSGLVRLYATYAANLYATSAAFTALSNAMDTSNMVRGLDQLGARSGIAMGSLSKQFSKVTGDAISMRDAMEATTKGISSGLSSNQLLKIAEVSKKASQALGIDMNDAVSRLTRGITKLEPELLDELGLFTKIGPSTDAYAKSIGKTASQLTDFEKRQAFANAVLKEGIDKFNEINIESNPYSKLLASLKNTSQTALETVNKILGPIVGFLSESPMSLTIAMAALVKLIAGQALPVLTNYRKAMRDAIADNKKFAEEKAQNARTAFEAVYKDKFAGQLAIRDAAAEAATQKVDLAEKILKASIGKKLDKRTEGILSKGVMDITPQDLALLDELGSKNTKVSQRYKDLASAIREAVQANKAYHDSNAQINAQAAKMVANPVSVAGKASRDLKSAERAQISSTILENLSSGLGSKTLSQSWTAFRTEVKTASPQLGKLSTLLLNVKGAAQIAATGLGLVASALGSLMSYVGLAVGIYQILSGIFSTNDKELSAFTDSIDQNKDAVKAANSTYAKFKDTLSIESVVASANTFDTLTGSLDAIVQKFEDVKAASSGLDKAINWISVFWGGSLEGKTRTAIVDNITASISAIRDPKVKQEYEDAISSILGTKNLSKAGLDAAFDKLDSDKFSQIGPKLAQAMKRANKETTEQANSLKVVQDRFTALENSYQALTSQFNQNTPLFTYGQDLLNLGTDLTTAFKNPVTLVAELNNLLKDTAKLKMLPPESQQLISANRKEFDRLTDSVAQLDIQLQQDKASLDELTKDNAYWNMNPNTAGKVLRLKNSITQGTENRQNIEAQQKESAKAIVEIAKQAQLAGTKLMVTEFDKTIKLAENAFQKSISDLIPKTTATSINNAANLELIKLDLQKQQLVEAQNLVKEQKKASAIAHLDALEAKQAIQVEQQKLPAARDNTTLTEALKTTEKDIQDTKDTIKALNSKNIAKDFNITDKQLTDNPTINSMYAAEKGLQAKLAELNRQQDIVRVKAGTDRIAANAQEQITNQDNIAKAMSSAIETIKANSEEWSQLPKEQQNAIERIYLAAQLNAEKESSRLKASIIPDQMKLIENSPLTSTDSKTAAASVRALAEEQNKISANLLDIEQNRKLNQFDTANAIEAATKAITEQNRQIQEQGKLDTINLDRKLQEAEHAQKQLDFDKERGLVTEQVYSKETLAIERTKIELEGKKAILSETLSMQSDILALSEELARAGDQTAKDLVVAKMQDRIKQYDSITQKINQGTSAQLAFNDAQASLNDRTKAYGDRFQQLFQDMGDAIVTFAQTGKFSFKDLVNGLIADLLRWELRAATSQLFGATGGSSEGGWLSTLIKLGTTYFTGTPADGSTNFMGPPSSLAGSSIDYSLGTKLTLPPGNALGAAYAGGIRAYAQGGMFTNSIVSNPTLFKAKDGLGLMGEAGPEAIMPLKRDSQGNLGVRTTQQQPKVDVIVNNYSGEKAETKETVDSKGNRKIEVVIGEMVAKEVGRPNSPANTSIKSNFLVQPRLTRR